MIEIRQETQKDYEEVYNVVKTAFASAEHSDGNEQDLVVALRNSNSFIPELSLVAIQDNKIVGYILFTKIKIGKYEELALAPLGILPEYQKQGIGKKLIERGHQIAKQLGYHFSIVLGSETYYTKSGYVSAIQYGIKAPFKVPNEKFMAIKLNDFNKEITGTVEYVKDFKLYNVIFPIWLIILMPPIISLVIPLNFIIDSLVLIIGFKALHATDKFKKYKKSILKVWGFGFLVDILGALLLFATQFLWFSDFISDNLIEPLMWNPFSNPLALIYALIIVAICGYLIYLINYRFSFKKTDLNDKERKVISMLLGVITAPYLFLLPTALFY